MILHGEDRNLGPCIGGEAEKGVDDELQRCLPLKKRHPTCARCRNHGLILDLKGHKRTCEYRDCRCSRCMLVSQRRIVMAKQVALSREQVRQRQDRDTAEQMQEGQRFYRDVPPPPEPPVIDLTSEEPRSKEIVYPVVQPSPDSTNMRYCSSPYSPLDSSQTNCSQPTLMTSSPGHGFGQASHHYYPASFPSSQINETHRPGLASPSNYLGRPVIPRPVVPLVPYQSSGPLSINLSDRIGGTVPSVNSLSSQSTFGQASQYYPTSLHTSRVDEMHRSTESLAVNQSVIPSHVASYESVDAPSGYFPNRITASLTNFSPSHRVLDQASQYYPTSFLSSRVDETYRCQVSVTANYTNRPVFPSPVVPFHSNGSMSAYRDNYISAKPQFNSTANAYAGDTVQTTNCYCNVTDEVHRQEYSYASSSRVAPFEEQVASMSSLPPSVMTAQRTFIGPNQNSLSSATSEAYEFQTTDEPPFFAQNADTYQDNELSFRSQVASTLRQPQDLPSIFSDSSSFGAHLASTSQQTQSMTSARSNDSTYLLKIPTTLEQPTGASSVKSDEPSYKSRRPFPLKITIPSLPLNQADGIEDQSPIDPSPTFSPSTLSLLDKVTLPSSDIQSPGFFTSSLPSFNYPSPTLPTQSSPVFSYPAPYTNPSQHARTSPFHCFPDSSPLPVIPTSQSTAKFAEQVRIPPTFDEDFDEDQEDGDIDVCSLDHYACH